jgi:cell division protein FtsW
MFTKILNKIHISGIDKTIFFSWFVLLIIGFFTFFSASLGFLNKNEDVNFFMSLINNQFLAYGIGFVLFIVFYLIRLEWLRKSSIYILGFAILVNLAVVIPGLGFTHGGSTRWLTLGNFSMQPIEILKFASILFVSSFLAEISKSNNDIKNFLKLLLAFVIILIPALLQKDLGGLAIIGVSTGLIVFLSDIKFRYIATLGTLGIALVVLYSLFNPYVRERVYDKIGIGSNKEGISYQTNQALIALGNGGLFGRGYGISVQKFYHLPEPAGDSIFAVYGEEQGLLGTVFVVFVFALIILRSLYLSFLENEKFKKYLIAGISSILFVQIFLNIGSMVDLIPLSGDTLPFFSKGGSAIIMNMIEIAVLLKLTNRKTV